MFKICRSNNLSIKIVDVHFMINLLLYITSTFQLSFNNNRKINKTIRKNFLGGWAFFCLFFFFVRVFCFVFYFVLSFVCLLFVFCLFLSFSLVLLAAWTWVGLKNKRGLKELRREQARRQSMWELSLIFFAFLCSPGSEQMRDIKRRTGKI